MPTVSIDHITRYRYRDKVAFGEHRIMTRPRESYDQRVLSASLDIDPEPSTLRWIQDVFGNAVAIATFADRSDRLDVRATAEVEHLPTPESDIAVEEYARHYPFTYAAEDMPDLLRSIERRYDDRDRRVDGWARRFIHPNDGDTLAMLRDITQTIRRDFDYNRRDEKGIQSPLVTLRNGSGTCRDFAMLMMEAVRALGFAARFVSGYIYDPDERTHRVGGHSTHAWVRVFLPGSGWIEFDPTNGIVGNDSLIRVAVARDPAHVTPLSGTWRGRRGSQIDMNVEVRLEHMATNTAQPRFDDNTTAGKEPIQC
ncbi:transglutaminase family protein [Aurantiacibacter spongiae]|uniref:Transglutaminase family protein n=1 Tax=Aurantiacibacter spongiae TaxID=2488860 RepID=A0A3N5DLC6_9SPHN|nr:transglutaminase family protein [Aurantiacibacter spongiae]RPF71585.1 transglutaminase family protein [Aurantiacibacter spongiae]